MYIHYMYSVYCMRAVIIVCFWFFVCLLQVLRFIYLFCISIICVCCIWSVYIISLSYVLCECYVCVLYACYIYVWYVGLQFLLLCVIYVVYNCYMPIVYMSCIVNNVSIACLVGVFSVCVCVILQNKYTASCFLGKCSTTELYPQQLALQLA